MENWTIWEQFGGQFCAQFCGQQLSGSFSVLFFQTLTICIEVGQGVLSQWKGCSMVVGDSAENAKEGSKEHKFASYSIDD